MSRQAALLLLSFLAAGSISAEVKRVIIIKLDGVPHDTLERELQHINPATGKSSLPWMDYIFAQRGTRMENFYVRGISLSAPSWSLLDTGQHMEIRGNAEFDRYTYHVYDYLNFFPFYFGYALSRRVDMPGVEVLDQIGIPLLYDRFPYQDAYQSFQLYQRGVRWKTLQRGVQRRFHKSPRDLLDEWTTGFEIGSTVQDEMEHDLIRALADPRIQYLDYFSGDFDHIAHLTPDVASQNSELRQIDSVIGRIWSTVEATPQAPTTAMVVVSDHGMNSTPGVYSQGYDLVRFFNSRAGGAHHVVTDRHPMTEYKLRGLDPFVSEVVTASDDSLYLKGASGDYPTALLDLDGNERASVYLRNSDLNGLQVLLESLSNRATPSAAERQARVEEFFRIIERNRSRWQKTTAELREELAALHRSIEAQRAEVDAQPRKWTQAQRDQGLDKAARRLAVRVDSERDQERRYSEYIAAMAKLLALSRSDFEKRAPSSSDLIPKRTMGDANTIHDLENYVDGPGAGAPFQTINYFSALTGITVRNNVQAEVGARPVDFIAMRVPREVIAPMLGSQDAPDQDAVWLYGDEAHQALILARRNASHGLELRYLAVRRLQQEAEGSLHFQVAALGPAFPLHLREDPELAVPEEERDAWLSAWHSEREWFRAVHRTRYSNGILGLHEQFLRSLPPAGLTGDAALLARFEARRRRIAEPDLIVFANDHWNFNVRGFNPGGNHGSLLRISTHSVLMFAGGDATGIPRHRVIEEPYDSLNFVPTILELMGMHREAVQLPGTPIPELLGNAPPEADGSARPTQVSRHN